MGKFRSSSATDLERYGGIHRFEHWYRDNTVYFITSKVRNGFAAFATRQARSIFWDRFEHWTNEYGLVPWAASLLWNHYHVVGYLSDGSNLGPMMQRMHGSVAKLVNDTLEVRHLPFWRERGNRDDFDGCLRDVLQAHRASWYTLEQAMRARLVKDWRDWKDTKLYVDLDERIRWAADRGAFLEEIPYARYDRKHGR